MVVPEPLKKIIIYHSELCHKRIMVKELIFNYHVPPYFPETQYVYMSTSCSDWTAQLSVKGKDEQPLWAMKYKVVMTCHHTPTTITLQLCTIQDEEIFMMTIEARQFSNEGLISVGASGHNSKLDCQIISDKNHNPDVNLVFTSNQEGRFSYEEKIMLLDSDKLIMTPHIYKFKAAHHDGDIGLKASLSYDSEDIIKIEMMGDYLRANDNEDMIISAIKIVVTRNDGETRSMMCEAPGAEPLPIGSIYQQ